MKRSVTLFSVTDPFPSTSEPRERSAMDTGWTKLSLDDSVRGYSQESWLIFANIDITLRQRAFGSVRWYAIMVPIQYEQHGGIENINAIYFLFESRNTLRFDRHSASNGDTNVLQSQSHGRLWGTLLPSLWQEHSVANITPLAHICQPTTLLHYQQFIHRLFKIIS